MSELCIIIGKLLIPLPNRQIGEIFDFFSPFLALPFAVGFNLRQRKASGIFGGVAFILLFMGLATVVSLDYFGAFVIPYLPEGMVDQIWESPAGVIAAVSLLVFLIGEILFGNSVIRAGVFSKYASILFVADMFLVPLGEVFPGSAVVIGSIIAGIGLIGWGPELYRQTISELDFE